MDYNMPLEKLMTKNPITVQQTDALLELQKIFDRHKMHHIPVVEKGKLIGLVSKSDLQHFLKGMAQNDYEAYMNQIRLKNYRVEEIMTKAVKTIEQSASLRAVLSIFKNNDFHALPVVDNGQLTGIITTHDIIMALDREATALTNQ